MSLLTPARRALLVAAGPPIIAHDSFNRADTASNIGACLTGQRWQADSGTWGISGGQAYESGGVAQSVCTIAGAANGTLTFTYIPQVGGDDGCVVHCRDDNNYLLLALRPTGSNVVIYKRSGGGFTQLAEAGLAWVGGTAYVIRYGFHGPRLDLYRDEIAILSHTLSAADWSEFGAYRRVGLRVSGSTGSRFDQFTLSRQ